MARKQVESECIFCTSVPCTCIVAEKKKPPSVRKKLSVPQVIVPLPEKLEVVPEVRSGIAGMGARAQQERDDDLESERDALTALFKVFDLEQVGDPGGFEAVRPKLKMSDADINIIRWKRRRQRWFQSKIK